MKLGAILKWGVLIKGNILERVAEEVFAVRSFYNGYDNLMKSQNYIIWQKANWSNVIKLTHNGKVSW
jgi:hypothetical protein